MGASAQRVCTDESARSLFVRLHSDRSNRTGLEPFGLTLQNCLAELRCCFLSPKVVFVQIFRADIRVGFEQVWILVSELLGSRFDLLT